ATSYQERIRPPLLTNRRRRPVTWVDDGIVTKREQNLLDRGDQHIVVAARQIGPPNRAGEQRVADEQLPSRFSGSSNLQADAARAMPRRVMHARLERAEPYDVVRRIEHVNRRLRLDREAEHLAHLDGVLIEKEVVAMEIDRRAERPFRLCDAGHVIDVGMRQQDVVDRELAPVGEREQLGDLVARIDQGRLVRLFAADDEAVLEDRTAGPALHFHVEMILAVLDDLMFTSKIKTTAGQLGVAVTFARSVDSALAEMRNTPPSLVILDLNNTRTN